MKLKFGIASSFALLAPVALASFELGLVDLGPFGIARIDVATGAYLGSFAQTIAGRSGMSIDPVNPGMVVVPIHNGAINRVGYARLNYSTGETTGFAWANTTSIPIGLTALSSGNLAFWMNTSGTNTISIRNQSMAVVNTFNLPAGTTGLVDFVELVNGASVALTRRTGTQNGTYRFDLNFFATANGGTPITQTIRDNVLIDQYNSLDFLGGMLAVGGSTCTDSEIFTISGTQATKFTEAFGLLRVSGGIAFGHGGTFSTMGLHAGTEMTLSKAHALVPDMLPTILNGIPKASVVDYDVVVAPEPASMLAVGLGAMVAGLRRRAK